MDDYGLSLLFDELKIIDIYDIVDHNNYLVNCKSNKKKDYNSISYLIDKPCSQSDCIKLGIAIERCLIDIILELNKNLINIKNTFNQRECDHLFMSKTNKQIYYTELKTNLNLDTEKSKSTINKCILIEQELKKSYPDYEIKWCLLGLRYLNNSFIPNFIINKYKSIQDNVLGINEYFDLLSINYKFDENEYKKFINYIMNKIINNS
jgi:hypothetical protein